MSQSLNLTLESNHQCSEQRDLEMDWHWSHLPGLLWTGPNVSEAGLSMQRSNVLPADCKDDEIFSRTTLLFLLRSKSPLRPSGVNKGRCSKWYANWKKKKKKKNLYKSTSLLCISDTSHLKRKRLCLGWNSKCGLAECDSTAGQYKDPQTTGSSTVGETVSYRRIWLQLCRRQTASCLKIKLKLSIKTKAINPVSVYWWEHTAAFLQWVLFNIYLTFRQELTNHPS